MYTGAWHGLSSPLAGGPPQNLHMESLCVLENPVGAAWRSRPVLANLSPWKSWDVLSCPSSACRNREKVGLCRWLCPLLISSAPLLSSTGLLDATGACLQVMPLNGHQSRPLTLSAETPQSYGNRTQGSSLGTGRRGGTPTPEGCLNNLQSRLLSAE